jgi:hypothetical protein
MLLLSIVMCVFVLLEKEYPCDWELQGLNCCFGRSQVLGKDLWEFKMLFHFCQTIEQIVKKCILFKYVKTIVSRQGKKLPYY